MQTKCSCAQGKKWEKDSLSFGIKYPWCLECSCCQLFKTKRVRERGTNAEQIHSMGTLNSPRSIRSCPVPVKRRCRIQGVAQKDKQHLPCIVWGGKWRCKRKNEIHKGKFFGLIAIVCWSQELWKIQKGLEIYMEDENIHCYFRYHVPDIRQPIKQEGIVCPALSYLAPSSGTRNSNLDTKLRVAELREKEVIWAWLLPAQVSCLL